MPFIEIHPRPLMLVCGRLVAGRFADLDASKHDASRAIS